MMWDMKSLERRDSNTNKKSMKKTFENLLFSTLNKNIEK